MAILEIIEFPDPRLRTVARAVESFGPELSAFLDDMLETMYQAQGIGLAATQVDRHVRVLVLDLSEDRSAPCEYINPEIVESQGEQICEEGCLSVPGIYAEVERARTITVRYQDRHGEWQEDSYEGMHAVCLQHEIDHLNGKVFVDYLSPLKRRMVQKKLEKQRRQARRETARQAI